MTPASMYTRQTFVSEHGISSRGFRSRGAADRFSTRLIIDTRRAESCSISGGFERGHPNSFGIWVVSWREASPARVARDFLISNGLIQFTGPDDSVPWNHYRIVEARL